MHTKRDASLGQNPSTVIHSPSKNSENISTKTTQPAEKLQDSSTKKFANATAKNSENISTITNPSAEKLQDSPTRKLASATANVQLMGDRSLTNFQSTPFSNNSTLRKHRTPPGNYQRNRSSRMVSRQTSQIDRTIAAPHNISKMKESFRPTANGTIHPMQTLEASNHQLASKYNRAIRSRQLSHRSTSRYLSTPEPATSQGYQGNMCHFEQLKPVPFRFLPLNTKNYRSNPVVESRSPTVDAMRMGMGVSYKSPMSPQWHKRQTHRMKSPVFGSKTNKNRQTLQSNIRTPNWPPSPIEFADKTVSSSNVAMDNSKGIASPKIENAANENVIVVSQVN